MACPRATLKGSQWVQEAEQELQPGALARPLPGLDRRELDAGRHGAVWGEAWAPGDGQSLPVETTRGGLTVITAAPGVPRTTFLLQAQEDRVGHPEQLPTHLSHSQETSR